MRIYSGMNMACGAGRHLHEGAIELVPGDQVVVSKAAIYSRFKLAEVSAKEGRLLPGFHAEGVTVNGRKPESIAVAIIEGLKSGDVVVRNEGTKKALVTLRLNVVEIEEDKKKEDAPPSQTLAPPGDAN